MSVAHMQPADDYMYYGGNDILSSRPLVDERLTSLALRQPQTPFSSNVGSSMTPLRIPPLQLQKLPKHSSKRYSPMPSVTAAMEATTLDSPTKTLVRDFYSESAFRRQSLPYFGNYYRNNETGRTTSSRSASRTPEKALLPAFPPLIPNPLHPNQLGQVPAEYLRDRLKDWGQKFYLEAASANAFVRAIELKPMIQRKEHRASTVSPISKSPRTPDPTGGDEREECIRIKIHPCAEGKRAFCISKPFPLRNMQAIGTKQPFQHYRVEKRLRKMAFGSGRGHVRRRSDSDLAQKIKLPRPAIPIHVEYALYATPLLAAILNSGHVHQGDTVELPLPFPEAWEDTVKWIYLQAFTTDSKETVEKALCNIEYLGGKADH